MHKISFARHRFPFGLIVHTGWLYCHFNLSFRDVEDLLAERGILGYGVSEADAGVQIVTNTDIPCAVDKLLHSDPCKSW